MWVDGHVHHRVSFEEEIIATPTRDGSGIVVVYQRGYNAPHNAIFINRDDSHRITIKNPEAKNGAIAFSDVYYVGNELTLIISFQSWQMACVIDTNGNVIRTYETR